jgi:hypothetical protein
MENSHEANDQPFVIFHAYCAPSPPLESTHSIASQRRRVTARIYAFLSLLPLDLAARRKTRSLVRPSSYSSSSSARERFLSSDERESESCIGSRNDEYFYPIVACSLGVAVAVVNLVQMLVINVLRLSHQRPSEQLEVGAFSTSPRLFVRRGITRPPFPITVEPHRSRGALNCSRHRAAH